MFPSITAADIWQILRPSRSRSKQSPELTGAGVVLIGGSAAVRLVKNLVVMSEITKNIGL